MFHDAGWLATGLTVRNSARIASGASEEANRPHMLQPDMAARSCLDGTREFPLCSTLWEVKTLAVNRACAAYGTRLPDGSGSPAASHAATQGALPVDALIRRWGDLQLVEFALHAPEMHRLRRPRRAAYDGAPMRPRLSATETIALCCRWSS